jgi:methionyl-tRNA formyltransferase
VRIVVLSSSLYSETACAVAVKLAQLGYAPVGAISLRSWDRGTLLRKVGQWGLRDAARYAQSKLLPKNSGKPALLHNPCLKHLLAHEGQQYRNLREIAAVYDFGIATCSNQNSARSVAQLKAWLPDLVIFTGGNIMRKELLEVPRLGVLNVHLGLLPEIRGMSSPEWSLLNGIPLGITIHYIDSGIDTGPILLRSEFPGVMECKSLLDLRNSLIAFGIEQLGQVVVKLDHGAISATHQSDLDKDNQYFVMHERLQALAAERLNGVQTGAVAVRSHG